MIKILFICHGNICRSPMAEFVMKKLVKDAGLWDRFEIASAATSREEIGNPVYPPARRELSRHGISCKGHAARQMTRADYDYYDYLVAMEPYNIRNMLRICDDPDGKMRLLMSFAGSDAPIDDPWYTGRFAEVYDQIEQGCRGMLEELGRR
ncbi:MAG: low molecular weight phosphotyrosine protein phosphatase [Clostridia bacterium]|nr:low molecular weight phosphotyrosine protein phosphatase [Clostridia bacterium]MBR6890409.1 low molecular weight phosphotyrosine protein phosphatase [Clostridia bacterium]